MSQFCRGQGLDDAQERVLLLILEELITNTIKHGAPPEDAPIDVALARDGDSVRISYRDRGTPFDPNRDAPEPDLADSLSGRRTGGLGWPLIKHYSSRLDYRRDADSNCLELIVPLGARDTWTPRRR